MPFQAEPLLQHIHRLASRPEADTETDGELLARFVRHKDEGAFAALVSRHAPMVLGVCRRILCDRHQAEDAAQAVFLILARKAAAVRPPDRLASWLYGVARQVAGNALRGKVRRQRREARAGQAERPPASRDPLDELTARELLAALEVEVQRLPVTFRLPVILCCLEGKSQEEAARQLGWTAGSVKGRLERGRTRLHARLVRRGLSLSAALAALEVARCHVRAGTAAALAPMTVRAALFFQGAGGVAGGIAPDVVALAEGVMKGTTVAKAKIGLVLLLSAGVLAAGASLVAQRVLAAKQPEVSDPPGKGPEKKQEEKAPQRRLTDRSGDPLPAGAVRRLGTTRLRHGWHTFSLAFSPDGKVLASTGYGRGLCLWDPETGREICHTAGPHGWKLAISPEGRLLASTHENGKIHLWEPKSGRRLRELPCSDDAAHSLAFSPDGTLLAAGGDKLIHLIEVSSGREVRTLRGHEWGVGVVAFAPDGKTLASGDFYNRADGSSGRITVRLWDLATGRQRARLTGHVQAVHDVAFFPDGKKMVSGSSDAIRLWDVDRGAEARLLDAPDPSGALAISPDGRLLATGHRHRSEGLIRLWDPATGRELRHWKAHFGTVERLAFTPDGKTLASCSTNGDGLLHLWDPATGQARLPFGGPQSFIAWLRFTADGKTVLLHSRDGTLRGWDWTADREQILATGEKLPFNTPLFSADGRVWADVVSESFDKNWITVWDDPRNAAGRVLSKAHFSWHLALSPDGKLLAVAGPEREIHLWDVPAGKELRVIQADQEIGNLAFSSDGKTLAAETHTPVGFGVGKTLENLTIRLWDVAGSKAVRAIPHGGMSVRGLVFSPDGNYLAGNEGVGSRAGPGPRLWDLARGEELARPAAKVKCSEYTFSPDSRLLAWGSKDPQVYDGHIHVVEVASQQEVLTLPGHPGGTNRLAFAPDGRLLASTGGDTTVLIWDLTGRYRDCRFAPVKASPADLEKLWTALADADAARAFQARQTLALAPAGQVVPLLRERLRLPAADAKLIAARIEDLDSREFDVREKAVRELESLGAAAEPALRRALAANPGPEARRRIQAVLEELAPVAREPLRKRRAVGVLEQLGTAPAREVLERLSQAVPTTFLNQEAKRALERLAERPSDTPD
jgi:RNA polymerase sigma factor (sigma-70 family)